MTLAVARQMIGAEILKVRRNRSVMAFGLLLTVVVVVVVYGYVAIQHSSNPLQNEPAGGTLGLHRGIRNLGEFFGMLAAVLIGAEVGTSDLSSGVFRDLVSTGRSRLALFAVRLPAAAIVTWCLSAAAYALVLVATFVFADGTATPSLGLILQGAGWIALANLVVTALAVGVGSLTGSRALTLTAVIGWQAIVTNLLVNVSSLGSLRDALLTPALTQIMPLNIGSSDHPAVMATGVAVVVILGWLSIPQLLGGWRTRTRDA
jgi:ABC-type transport system involved in multi-copper enzyme maturation permease subunit